MRKINTHTPKLVLIWITSHFAVVHCCCTHFQFWVLHTRHVHSSIFGVAHCCTHTLSVLGVAHATHKSHFECCTHYTLFHFGNITCVAHKSSHRCTRFHFGRHSVKHSGSQLNHQMLGQILQSGSWQSLACSGLAYTVEACKPRFLALRS